MTDHELTPNEAIGVDLDGFSAQVLEIAGEWAQKVREAEDAGQVDQLTAQALESISGSAFGLCHVTREHALIGALRSIAASQAIKTQEDAEAVLEAHRTTTGGIVQNPDGTTEFRPK